MEKYMINKGNPYLDFNDEVCNKYLRLVMLLYADDTVIFSNSALGLQKCMDNLLEYCNKWKLTVNCDKTKIIIFRRKKAKNNPKFIFNGKDIEVVEEFQYLGVTFNYKGNFASNHINVKGKATRALFALLSKHRSLNLPIDITIDIFDKTVIPIMLYGIETIGVEDCKTLETIHLKFCKYLLNVKTSTPNCMIYGELGRYPVHITITTRIISYWFKLLSSKQTKLNRIIYDVLFYMYVNDIYKSKWLDFVKKTLDNNGFGYIWVCQGVNINYNMFKSEFKNRLVDVFKQEWKVSVEQCRKCILYKYIKTTFKFEQYLTKIPWSLCKYLVKFRTCNHKLTIETGRYNNIEINQRTCDICNMNLLGDEYHLFYDCDNIYIVYIRNKLIPTNIIINKSMYNFVKLLSQPENMKCIRRICKFLKLSNVI